MNIDDTFVFIQVNKIQIYALEEKNVVAEMSTLNNFLVRIQEFMQLPRNCH